MSKRPLHSPSSVRGETLLLLATIERDAKGKLLVSMLMQLDFKLRMPSFVMGSFMPSAMKTWY